MDPSQLQQQSPETPQAAAVPNGSPQQLPQTHPQEYGHQWPQISVMPAYPPGAPPFMYQPPMAHFGYQPPPGHPTAAPVPGLQTVAPSSAPAVAPVVPPGQYYPQPYAYARPYGYMHPQPMHQPYAVYPPQMPFCPPQGEQTPYAAPGYHQQMGYFMANPPQSPHPPLLSQSPLPPTQSPAPVGSEERSTPPAPSPAVVSTSEDMTPQTNSVPPLSEPEVPLEGPQCHEETSSFSTRASSRRITDEKPIPVPPVETSNTLPSEAKCDLPMTQNMTTVPLPLSPEKKTEETDNGLEQFLSSLKARIETLSPDERVELVASVLDKLGKKQCIDALVETFGEEALERSTSTISEQV